jgi:hypothetical protein
MMAKPDFEATWYPRIGRNAAEELRRGRKIGIYGFTMPLFAIAAGLLIGTGALNDVIGGVLVIVAAGYFVTFIRAQLRIAAALSEWYGVKIRGIPKMNPKRFDSWSEARGLHRPGEQVSSGQAARSSDAAPGQSR